MAPGGRSTGCKTCRMRHLKCDERHPTCFRCEKAGMECRGYEVINVFVDERSKILQRGTKAKPDHRKRPKPRIENELKHGLGLDGTASTLFTSQAALPASQPLFTPAGSSSSSCLSSSDAEEIMVLPYVNPSPLMTLLPQMEDDIFSTYMVRKMWTRLPLFNIDPLRPERNPGLQFRAGWLVPALLEPNPEPPLAPAVRALSRAWFAKMEHQPSVAAQGMIQYGKALKDLKKAISVNQWRDRNVMTAAMCLILYETITLTDTGAWISHARGLSLLMERQGPEQFQDDAGLILLRANRYSMIMAATLTNTESFLDRDEWQSIPWQQHPEAKDDNDYLFDIFAAVPGLMKRVRQWERSPITSSAVIMAGVLESLRRLCDWRWAWEMANPGAVWVKERESDEPAVLFSSILAFKSLPIAHVVGVHDSVLMMLFWLALRLYDQKMTVAEMIPDPPATLIKSNALILPGVDVLDAFAIGRQICQTVKYRLQYVESSAVAFSLFLPTRMSWSILQDCPEEAAWLRTIVSWLEGKSGIEFGKLVYWAAGIIPKRIMISNLIKIANP